MAEDTVYHFKIRHRPSPRIRPVRILWVALLIAPALSSVAFGINSNFVFGGRTMTSDVWDPVDNHDSLSWMMDLSKIDINKWKVPFHLELGSHYSEDDKTFQDPRFGRVREHVQIGELSLGCSKIFPIGRVRPYVGVGGSLLRALQRLNVNGGGSREYEWAGGLYVHGGIYWRLHRRLNLGLDVRHLISSSVDFFGVNGNLDYTQYGLLVGWGKFVDPPPGSHDDEDY